jgi:hypothetical protein
MDTVKVSKTFYLEIHYILTAQDLSEINNKTSGFKS